MKLLGLEAEEKIIRTVKKVKQFALGEKILARDFRRFEALKVT